MSKENRKHLQIILTVCLFSLCVIQTGCKNFLSGTDVLQEIETLVSYENKPYAKVTIEAASDYTKQITPVAGLYDKKYKVQDKINLNFIQKNEYQFISWKVEPQDAVTFENIESAETVATIQNTDKPITIKPVCVLRPTASFEPENRSDGVAKNTSVVITFSQPLDISEEDLSRIKITSGLENLTYNFQPPKLSEDRKKVTFVADRTNLISLASGTKVVTVTVPQDFYYVYQNKNIELQDTATYSYRINAQTSDKATISIKASEKEGQISYTGSKTYYLDDEIKVKFTPDSSYILQGWKIVDTDGKEISKTVLQTEISEDLQSISVKVLTGYDKEIQIQPVCTVKGKLTVNFEKTEGTVTPAGKAEYFQKDEFNISYDEGTSGYAFLYWTVYDSITQKPADAVLIEDEKAPATKVTVIKDNQNITIKPVCAIRPAVSVEPENRSDGVAKNTPLVITFSQPLDITEEDLDRIKITSGMEDLSVNFEYPPTLNEDKTKITFIADRKNLIKLTSGTKLVTVTVPQNFYYLYEEKPVTLKEDFTYSYRVNAQTLDKVTVNVSTVTGGDISYTGKDTYNLDDELTVTYTPLTTYNFSGWSITNSDGTEITNEDGILQISDTSKQTLTVKVLSGSEKEIKIAPVCNPKGKLSANFTTTNGSITPSEPKQYYKGDEFTLTYTEGTSGYAFLYWKVLDSETQQDVTDAVTLNKDKFTTTVKVEKDTGNITIIPECKRRPTVMSRSPEKTAEGAFRDAKIEVVFNQSIDENSIYYTASELALIPNGYTLLPEGSTKESKNVYGYWKKGKTDTIVFKNITITDNNNGENCLQYYDAPFFDTPSTLIIPARSDNAPTAGKVIKVELDGSGFKHKEKIGDHDIQISLNSDCYWIYTVNSNTDIYPPSIPEGYKVDIYAKSFDDNTTKKRPEIDKEITSEWLKNQENLKSIYLPDNSITVDAYLFDSGSGLAEKGGLYLNAVRLYDEKYKKIKTQEVYQKDFTLEVSGTGGGCKASVNFKQTGENGFTETQKELPDGVYQLDFCGKDKNGNKGVVKTYYVLLDNTAPDKVEIENANYVGYDKTIYFSYKTPDIADLETPTISIFKGDLDETKNLSVFLEDGTITYTDEPTNGSIYILKMQTCDIFGNSNEHGAASIEVEINTNTVVESIKLDRTDIKNNADNREIKATITFKSIGNDINNLQVKIDENVYIKLERKNFDLRTLKATVSFTPEKFTDIDKNFGEKTVSLYSKDKEITSSENSITYKVYKSPDITSFHISENIISIEDIKTKKLQCTISGINLNLADKITVYAKPETENKKTDEYTINVENQTEDGNYTIKNEIDFPSTADDYLFQVVVDNFTCEDKQVLLIYGEPEFTKFTIPSATNSEANGSRYVTAEIEGRFFQVNNIVNIDPDKLKLQCDTDTFEYNREKIDDLIDTYETQITIQNDKKITITIPIIFNPGRNQVTLKYNGVNKIVGLFNIENTIMWRCGDVIMSDGSCISSEEILTEGYTLPTKINDFPVEPIAVIFGESSITGKKLGVGIKNSIDEGKPSMKWFNGLVNNNIILDEIEAKATKKTGTMGYDLNEGGDVDGSDNFAKVSELLGCSENSLPAFDYAINFGKNHNYPYKYQEGWYLPSIYELEALIRCSIMVDYVLEKIGNKMDIYSNTQKKYWSSSSISLNQGQYRILYYNTNNTSPFINTEYMTNGGQENSYSSKYGVLAIRAF